jgi:hypothetical protein
MQMSCCHTNKAFSQWRKEPPSCERRRGDGLWVMRKFRSTPASASDAAKVCSPETQRKLAQLKIHFRKQTRFEMLRIVAVKEPVSPFKHRID